MSGASVELTSFRAAVTLESEPGEYSMYQKLRYPFVLAHDAARVHKSLRVRGS